jgi:OOP family OmpA-OmpF porin
VADSEALLEDVRFVFNSTEFAHPASAFQSLQQVAHVLERHPEARLLIEGHTCDLGEERFNLVLSCKRADSVAAYLIGLGIDSHRLITTGFGEADPIVSVQNADGAAQAEAKRTVNRRARLRLAAPTGQR